ncbi:hypothetical protein ROHU_020884 [Labeo rohita]|uniref:Uncharacterized protein n=1 Tax=Labeo rohita TaxID=84645 RepID=A0A498NB11_LABRO|nr:hypothetical protein ROHU_020884 [Labeo rohita]
MQHSDTETLSTNQLSPIMTSWNSEFVVKQSQLRNEVQGFQGEATLTGQGSSATTLRIAHLGHLENLGKAGEATLTGQGSSATTLRIAHLGHLENLGKVGEATLTGQGSSATTLRIAHLGHLENLGKVHSDTETLSTNQLSPIMTSWNSEFLVKQSRLRNEVQGFQKVETTTDDRRVTNRQRAMLSVHPSYALGVRTRGEATLTGQGSSATTLRIAHLGHLENLGKAHSDTETLSTNQLSPIMTSWNSEFLVKQSRLRNEVQGFQKVETTTDDRRVTNRQRAMLSVHPSYALGVRTRGEATLTGQGSSATTLRIAHLGHLENLGKVVSSPQRKHLELGLECVL